MKEAILKDQYLVKKIIKKFKIKEINGDLVYPDESGEHFIVTEIVLRKMIKEVLNEEDFRKRNYF